MFPEAFPLTDTIAVASRSLTRVFLYIDPGTGSYLIQVLAGSLLAIAYAIKVQWRRIKAFFARLFDRRREGENDR